MTSFCMRYLGFRPLGFCHTEPIDFGTNMRQRALHRIRWKEVATAQHYGLCTQQLRESSFASAKTVQSLILGGLKRWDEGRPTF